MLLEINFKSKQLKKETEVIIVLPRNVGEEVTDQKVLWLFHGLSDNQKGWMRRTAIERYAIEHNIAVVMPNVDRSWYTDSASGMNYLTFVTRELPELCHATIKGLSRRREDNIVGGLSMGGYGALKAALTYPEQYAACISLSGSVYVGHRERPEFLAEWKSIFGYDMEKCVDLLGSQHDLFALAEQNREAGLPFPKLFLWCGLEDSLLEANRAFDRHLTELGVEHHYEESEGNHSWKWWDLHIKRAMEYVLKDQGE